MSGKNITQLSLTELLNGLENRLFTSKDICSAYLDNIEEKNKDINAYLEVFSDAMDFAIKADKDRKNGKKGKLLGIPIAIKDNILIKGKISSCASKILANHRATYDATVIEKLKKEGAIFLGRTNMDEFAMGSSTENSAYGTTKNPHDLTRVPGGSSGGSAAAVAGGLSPIALGSDTGGSVRQPASLCGVVGFKPTYGAVSRYGLVALTSSFDQIGPLAKTVSDAEFLFDIMSGKDDKDSTSISIEKEKIKKDGEFVIGVPRDFMKEGVDEDVLKNFEASLSKLKEKGATIKDISISSLGYALHALPVYYIIMPAEGSANLARFDGVRYGVQVKGDNLLSTYKKSRGEGFGKEVRKRIMLGTYVLSSGYYDAYYGTAMSVQNMIKKELDNVFKDCDAIATPTSPTPAFKIGEKVSDPISMYIADIFTVTANIAGIPAISIPSGNVSVDGKMLPLGIQFIAKKGRDKRLLSLGKYFEAI